MSESAHDLGEEGADADSQHGTVMFTFSWG